MTYKSMHGFSLNTLLFVLLTFVTYYDRQDRSSRWQTLFKIGALKNLTMFIGVKFTLNKFYADAN